MLKEFKDLRVLLGSLVHKDRKVRKESPEPKVLKALKESQVLLDPRESPDLKAPKGNRVLPG